MTPESPNPATGWQSPFTTDPFYFGKYYLANLLVYGAATLAAGIWTNALSTVSPWWLAALIPLFLPRLRYILAGSAVLIPAVLWAYRDELTWTLALGIAVAIYIGHITAAFVHNAAHFNFRPRWLNVVIGELSALQQLSAGLVVFRFVHHQHHLYPDDPVRDPHPPQGRTFVEYVDSARLLIGKRLTAMYFEQWGPDAHSQRMWKLQNALLLATRFMKTLFLFVLLGPKLFALFFLPSYVANVLLFAAFNFFSHEARPDGTTEIKDLHGRLYYDLCNRFAFGVMYHKTHHLLPRAFNPMKAAMHAAPEAPRA